MQRTVNRGGAVIFLSFVIAIILAIVPLPENLISYRPQWVSLVLIFWCMMLPHRIGVFTGWCVGLFLDVLYGSLLGANALNMAVLAFLSYKLQTRLRLYPILQQSLIILLLIALQQMLVIWVKGISGNMPTDISYWLPTLTSTLIWPVIAFLLNKTKRFFGIV